MAYWLLGKYVYSKEEVDTLISQIPKGEAGAVGPTGPKGETGPAGPTGEKGIFDISTQYSQLNTNDKTIIGAINEIKKQVSEDRFWIGTQEQYDAIEVKNKEVLYFITE